MLDFGKGRSAGFAKHLGVLLAIFWLVGCAQTGLKTETAVAQKKETPQEIVARKAQARWDALIKGDLDTAYKYLSPGKRSVMSLDLYKAKTRAGLWKSVSVDSVSCERDVCKAGMYMEYSYRNAKSIRTWLEETWMEVDGDWWFVPRR